MDFTSEYGKELFQWIPSDFFLDMGLDGNYSKQKLIISYLFFFIFIVVLIPIIEELYFRGFLLPRMPAGSLVWASVFHSALFALYHTWTPWMFVARTFGVLPLIYAVRKKENIYIGIIAHCILNSIDFIVGLLFILKM
ncbi:MAG: CPBP family intramembrane glutamic endopeptidase, partial [Bacteroidota bacterium]